MLDYLKEYFGLNVYEEAWDDEKILPLYLRKSRRFSILQLENEKALCIKLNSDDFKVATYLKQVDKLATYWDGNVILAFNGLSRYQIAKLIQNRIAFIIPNAQIYLPFIGTFLKEGISYKKDEQVEKLSSTSQLIVLSILYHKLKELRQADVNQYVNASPMTISRAVNELISLGLVSLRTNGREKYIFIEDELKEFFEKSKQYLDNPVCKTVYVEEAMLPKKCPIAGETALSRYSMLNAPNVECRAIWRKEFNKANIEMIDPNWTTEKYVALQLWSYDPIMLTKGGAIEELALMLSLKDETDERVEEAVESMMEEYRW